MSMLNRRQALQVGVSAIAALPLARPAITQAGAPVKIRYSEVVHSLLFAPAYVALAKGIFRDAGLDVTMTTAQGGDKAMAALLGGSADIALIGPETAIYVLGSDSPTKARIFCGLTATDGYLLVARQKVETFDWHMLKGRDVIGWRPGSTPLLYLEAAMRLNGLDPAKDVRLNNNIAVPARTGAWLSGQGDFAIFGEPDAAQLELDGKAHVVASVGQTVGFVDYTVFMATDPYIRDNPAVLQSWTNAIAKAETWTAAAPVADLARSLEPFFPGVSGAALTAGIERYRRLGIWKSSPGIAPDAIEKFQDILVQGHVLEPARRVKYTDVVLDRFTASLK
jgi:NitT/TauT family transport system substrate-binding protein